MKKAKRLQKKVVIQAVITAVVIGVGAGMVVGSGMLQEKALARKTAAEGSRNQLQGQLTTMQNQIAQSGDAEKQFLIINSRHASADYSANSDTLKEWLRAAKDQYRLGDGFKLTLALEQQSDKEDLSTLAYDVKLRNPVKLELDAMSDMHVFSFLDQMMQQAPGMVSITKFEMTRTQDMEAGAISQMQAGGTPLLVHAVIEFLWVGLEPKASSDAAPAAPGA